MKQKSTHIIDYSVLLATVEPISVHSIFRTKYIHQNTHIKGTKIPLLPYLRNLLYIKDKSSWSQSVHNCAWLATCQFL